MKTLARMLLNIAPLVAVWPADSASAEGQLATARRDAMVITTLHAEGAQIYECQPFAGKSPSEAAALSWQIREPIASLMVDGKTIGRHYAGPNWDLADGGGVTGKVIASAPGETADDIPWLELEVVDHRNTGILSEATTVLRINTKGGIARGSCEQAGRYRSVPYAADYVFLRRRG